ncbi:MAG: DEAD/DEAH box helicase [Lautropia sp.]
MHSQTVEAHPQADPGADGSGPAGPAAELPAAAEATTLTFADFGLAPPIVRAVTEMGYVVPTPIQAQAIPVVMSGRDVMGGAQTGTGKTAGFALPIIHALLPLASTSTSPARHPVRALMLAPTRELADQIAVNVKAYAKYTPLRSAVVFGGVDMKPQTQALREGVEILIATPGRLLDHVEQRTANLSQVQLLVLDEADRMLDMGFLPDIQRIINLLNKQRQSLMFSATFSDEIRKLSKSFLKNPQLIEVARRNALAEHVEQCVYRVDSEVMKRAAVAQLVRERGIEQVIVFTNTKLGASRLARELVKDGLNADAIHGDKSQQERLQTLASFKAGTIKVLVATDVAARGLDIAELPAVINYDLPHSPEDYVHRIGRTGRAGASGMALSLMTEKDERYLADIEKLVKRKLPCEALIVRLPPRGEGTRSARAPERGSRERSHERPADRADRAERGEGRGGARGGERGRGGAARQPAADAFFFKPYEPETGAGERAEAAEAPAEAQRGTARKGQAKLAVLLGGKVPTADAPNPN